MTLNRHTIHAAVLIAALALPLYAHADPCKLEISGNDQMQFDKTSLSVPATCKQVTVTLHHSGKLPKEAMGHDWVLVDSPDYQAVANSGMSAGLASDYIAPNDKHVIAHTKVIGGGQSDSVTFSTANLKSGASYSYLCTFPGHSAQMHGVFKFG